MWVAGMLVDFDLKSDEIVSEGGRRCGSAGGGHDMEGWVGEEGSTGVDGGSLGYHDPLYPGPRSLDRARPEFPITPHPMPWTLDAPILTPIRKAFR